MADYNLVGRIRPVYKGVWNAETAYTVLETVTAADNHAAYMAIRDVPSGIPLNNEEYWGVLVDIGGLEGVGGVTEEFDPTVPEWAKAEAKPSYTAAEVGAIADASGVLQSKHYGNNSIMSTKLADDAVWPRHISDLTWTEVDKHIDAALENVGGGSGTPGEAGEDGGYYTPTVASDGTLIWTASKSDMPTIPSANIKGPAGADGEKGETGPAGPAGSSGVYIGSSAPTDPSVRVWIDTDGEAEGGGSVDLSNYYTKEETVAQIEAALGVIINGTY